jgi:hypothetical protein
VELDRDFEDAVREAMAAEIATRLRESDRAAQIVREATRDALVEAGYEDAAESFLGALVGPVVDSNPPGSTLVRVAWAIDHEAAQYLEHGTSDHVIEGDPVLAFEWPDAPAEVQAMFEDTFPLVFFQSVEVSGVQATHHTERAVRALRRELER